VACDFSADRVRVRSYGGARRSVELPTSSADVLIVMPAATLA
jgi:hypothetical protein